MGGGRRNTENEIYGLTCYQVLYHWARSAAPDNFSLGSQIDYKPQMAWFLFFGHSLTTSHPTFPTSSTALCDHLFLAWMWIRISREHLLNQIFWLRNSSRGRVQKPTLLYKCYWWFWLAFWSSCWHLRTTACPSSISGVNCLHFYLWMKNSELTIICISISSLN